MVLQVTTPFVFFYPNEASEKDNWISVVHFLIAWLGS